jgi:type IV secretory pathway VirJ component
VNIHTRCKSSTSHYRLLLSYLDQLIANPERNKTTSAAEALHQIAESIHKRSMVVIFSDMFEQTDEVDKLFSALQHLKHNKHEVVLFHTVDKSKEIDFDFENRPYLFVDMETGEQVRLQSNQVKDYYVEQMAKFKEQLRIKCLQYKIDFVEADINAGFKPILQSYLVKRTKMGV